MMDRLHLGMVLQIVHQPQCIGHMALHPEGQGLQSLEEKEGVEWGQGSSGIPQEDRPDVGRESRRSCRVGKGDPMIAGVGLGDPGIAPRCFPVKVPAVHDHAADGGPVSADELRGGMDHDIRAILDRPDQVRGGECGIHHQGDLMAVGDLGQSL